MKIVISHAFSIRTKFTHIFANGLRTRLGGAKEFHGDSVTVFVYPY